MYRVWNDNVGINPWKPICPRLGRNLRIRRVEVELGEEEEGGGAGGQDGDESAGDGALACAVDWFGEDVVGTERHG
eukprot:scaffold70131_cov66-Cyclotella_meneghiniana.AAC.12